MTKRIVSWAELLASYVSVESTNCKFVKIRSQQYQKSVDINPAAVHAAFLPEVIVAYGRESMKLRFYLRGWDLSSIFSNFYSPWDKTQKQR